MSVASKGGILLVAIFASFSRAIFLFEEFVVLLFQCIKLRLPVELQVMEEEVEAIRAGIRNFGSSELGVEDYSPPIVCIIACKRHNKRFAVEGSKSFAIELYPVVPFAS